MIGHREANQGAALGNSASQPQKDVTWSVSQKIHVKLTEMFLDMFLLSVTSSPPGL